MTGDQTFGGTHTIEYTQISYDKVVHLKFKNCSILLAIKV